VQWLLKLSFTNIYMSSPAHITVIQFTNITAMLKTCTIWYW